MAKTPVNLLALRVPMAVIGGLESAAAVGLPLPPALWPGYLVPALALPIVQVAPPPHPRRPA